MSGLGDLQGSNAQTPRASAAFFSSPFQALSSLPLLLAAVSSSLCLLAASSPFPSPFPSPPCRPPPPFPPRAQTLKSGTAKNKKPSEKTGDKGQRSGNLQQAEGEKEKSTLGLSLKVHIYKNTLQISSDCTIGRKGAHTKFRKESQARNSKNIPSLNIWHCTVIVNV